MAKEDPVQFDHSMEPVELSPSINDNNYLRDKVVHVIMSVSSNEQNIKETQIGMAYF